MFLQMRRLSSADMAGTIAGQVIDSTVGDTILTGYIWSFLRH